MESGKGRRYRRLMGSENRTVIVATDDGLISGPTGRLRRWERSSRKQEMPMGN